MSTDMDKAYTPSAAESRWYAEWESRGLFHGNVGDRSGYTIVIPPPNVTGVLTLGHVLNNTLQDILIRWQKMQGKEVCWVPGTDHAGIATQSKVETFLRETEQLTRYDLGREAFLERVREWKEKYGGTIIRQLRSLGTACDWRRERFTLDDGLSNAVEEVFIRLHQKGLIYKGKRMINWCPKSRTALSDEEVIYRAENGKLWHVRYPYSDGSGYLVVATTRPETMLGDSGVAVHPDDDRYCDVVGKTIDLPLCNRQIPIFADAYVDREFGTGAVKVTPAHDPNDYEMAQRHGLDVINILNDDGSVNDNVPEPFRGLDRYACRDAVVAALTELGIIDKIEPHDHQVGYSERGNVVVEPRLSEQWFVRMQPLAEPAIAAVRDGKVRFHPERWVNTYNHWMENIKDWCISRQLWWGHRIPAYYCQSCAAVVVARTMPSQCDECGGDHFEQDEDVLDTWFSSWLWPFSVFDWPDDNDDLKHFYPTQSLVTGPDIIFFWVARMIMAGIEFMDEVPFRDVYFTSIIRDDQGRKLSKSLNNSPDPLEVIATYGADALRFSIIYIAPVGQDIRYSNEKCEIGRNFANKLWNACRFRQLQGPILSDAADFSTLAAADLRPDDRWIIAELNAHIESITASLEAFSFHSYAIQLYEFVWNEFCDWYVESAKSAFYSDDDTRKNVAKAVFDGVLSNILRLLHPAMPFVTEELYHAMGFVDDDESVMHAAWPTPLSPEQLAALGISEQNTALVKEKFALVKAGRNLRSSYNVPFSRKIPYHIKPTNAEFATLLTADPASLKALLNAESITIDTEFSPTNTMPSAVGNCGLIYMPLDGIVDINEEIRRLSRQRDELTALLNGIQRKLNNEKFITRAPDDVVNRERERQTEFAAKLEQVNTLMATLSKG